MWVWQLSKLFLGMFLLREKPEDIPYSKFLLGLLLVCAFSLKNATNLGFVHVMQTYAKEGEAFFTLTFANSSIIVLVSFLLLWACVYSTLSFFKVKFRTIQVMCAVLGADIILTTLTGIWIFVLYQAPAPLPAQSLFAWGLVLSFIFLLYWQFMVYIHIFLNSISISILQAGIFALLYMLLQHNVAELLLSVILQLEK